MRRELAEAMRRCAVCDVEELSGQERRTERTPRTETARASVSVATYSDKLSFTIENDSS